MITSAAALCLRVAAGWPTPPCQASGSTAYSTTTSVLPRLARAHCSCRWLNPAVWPSRWASLSLHPGVQTAQGAFLSAPSLLFRRLLQTLCFLQSFFGCCDLTEQAGVQIHSHLKTKVRLVWLKTRGQVKRRRMQRLQQIKNWYWFFFLRTFQSAAANGINHQGQRLTLKPFTSELNELSAMHYNITVIIFYKFNPLVHKRHCSGQLLKKL